MTLLQIYQQAILRFGDQYSNSQGRFAKDSGALAYALINDGYREVCRRTRCSRVTTPTTITTVDGTREYALATDLAALERVEYWPTGSTVGYKLGRIRDGDLQPARGHPESYRQVGDTAIDIDPVPNDAYTLKYWYYQVPSADLISTDTPTLIPAAWHHLLVLYTVMWFFRIDKGDSSGGAQTWERLYEIELKKFERHLREGANADSYAGVR